MKNILCYGDSNTWGTIPVKATRYNKNVRWPGVASEILGDEYNLIEDAIVGRTTIFDDPFISCRNGMKNLGYSLLAHMPLDMVIVFLGSNDLKYTDAAGSARGAARIIELIKKADAVYDSTAPMFPNGLKILLISPTELNEHFPEVRPEHMLAGMVHESTLLSETFRAVAESKGVHFLAAADFVKPGPEDCIHLSPESHKTLGTAIAEKTKEIFE